VFWLPRTPDFLLVVFFLLLMCRRLSPTAPPRHGRVLPELCAAVAMAVELQRDPTTAVATSFFLFLVALLAMVARPYPGPTASSITHYGGITIALSPSLPSPLLGLPAFPKNSSKATRFGALDLEKSRRGREERRMSVGTLE